MTEKPVLSLIEILWIEQKGRCYLCGYAMDQLVPNSPRYRSVDHVIPLSKGGKNHPSNKRLACRICNTAKGNLLPAEWHATKEATDLHMRRFLARKQKVKKQAKIERLHAKKRTKSISVPIRTIKWHDQKRIRELWSDE